MAQHKNHVILLNWNTMLFPAVQKKLPFEEKKKESEALKEQIFSDFRNIRSI